MKNTDKDAIRKRPEKNPANQPGQQTPSRIPAFDVMARQLKNCRDYERRRRRVRAAGWSNEDRKDLLGHKNGDITTHYSRVEIDHLREVVESIVRKISYIEGRRRLGKCAKSLKKWWLRPDLNRGPHHYE